MVEEFKLTNRRELDMMQPQPFSHKKSPSPPKPHLLLVLPRPQVSPMVVLVGPTHTTPMVAAVLVVVVIVDATHPRTVPVWRMVVPLGLKGPAT